MGKPSAYLAGPMSGLTAQQAMAWREAAALALARAGIRTISPLRGTAALFGADTPIPALTQCNTPFASDKSFTRRDLNDVRRADVVLANYLGAVDRGIGTALEIGFAFALSKPIVLVIDEQDNPNDHMMLRECAGWIAHTLEDAMDIIEEIVA